MAPQGRLPYECGRLTHPTDHDRPPVDEQNQRAAWAAPACKTVSIRRDPDEKLSVAVTSDEASLLFRPRSVALSAARVGLVSSSV